MDIILFVGVVGAGVSLLFFILNQFGVVSIKNISYDIGNVISGLLLMIYAYLIDSVPFLILNAVWFLVSFKDVVVYFSKRS